jgi:hypothetical protein
MGVINKWAFIYACSNGYLVVAQWLYQIKPDIDISADNDCAFSRACENGHLKVSQWLYNLLPSKYHIEILDNRIINCQINLKLSDQSKINQ